MPAITYYPGIPLAADEQDFSQPQILANFTGINSWTAINHYNFASANAGKHSALQLPEQAAPPTTAVNEGALYAKVGATTAVTELAFRRENSGGGGGAIIEMTATGTDGTIRWSMLPSGLLVKWGTTTVNGINHVVDITGGPNFASAINVQANGNLLPSDNVIIRTSGLTDAQFLLHYITNSTAHPKYTITYTGAIILVYWTVIGLPA